ncbi:glycosyltransferase family 4 protein [candidate division WOR-3 bacterium]|nr:glycosyltransferase family 4 protein [candidate division WOR-3 bacterium]
MRKKRVCIVRHNYYPQENHVCRDAETLRDAGYQVDIICLKLKNEKNFEIVNRINIYRMPVHHQRGGTLRYIIEYAIFFILSSIKLIILHLEKKYDIIEGDTMPDFLVFTTVIPKLLGAKVLLYMFENMPELYAFEHKISMEHPITKFFKIVEKLSLKFADKVIVTHEPARRIFIKHGIPKSKFTIVLNVPNECIFSSDFYKVEKQDKKNFLLVSHGSILERYGYQIMVRALKLLETTIPNLRLLIVGDGEYKSEVERVVKNLKLEERVKFTGYVPFDEIPMTIGIADIGIVPILCKYPTLPNKLFEYIALGIPTIASALPTMKAYFDDDSVMFFELCNENDLARCILELYKNPAKRKSLVANASKVYEKYRWSIMKKKYLKVYEELLSGEK